MGASADAILAVKFITTTPVSSHPFRWPWRGHGSSKIASHPVQDHGSRHVSAT